MNNHLDDSRQEARSWKLVAVLLGILVAGAIMLGFLHVVHGGNIGFVVVGKDEWGLHDTFVDWGEIEEMSLLEVAGSGHAGVVRALVRSGHLPELEERLRRMREASEDIQRTADEPRQDTFRTDAESAGIKTSYDPNDPLCGLPSQ